jgi:aldose 1-epimerase
MPRPVLELTAGPARATVDAARGGRLASLRVGGRELLVPPPDDIDTSIHWGSFLMAPWPGRLAGGRLRWRGRTIQLRRTHGRHAIHGLAWATPWTVDRSSRSEVEMHVDLERDGWPFGGEVRQSLRLEPARLTLEAAITAERPMPAALGWHPWFQRGSPDPRLTLTANGVLERHAMLPTGAVRPLVRRTDLRAGPTLGRRRLDDAFTGARSPAILRWPDLELRLDFGPECDVVVAYTPWNAICIEPQTARPNALGLPDAAARSAGRRDLEAGETLRSTLRIAWRSPGPASTG